MKKFLDAIIKLFKIMNEKIPQNKRLPKKTCFTISTDILYSY